MIKESMCPSSLDLKIHVEAIMLYKINYNHYIRVLTTLAKILRKKYMVRGYVFSLVILIYLFMYFQIILPIDGSANSLSL